MSEQEPQPTSIYLKPCSGRERLGIRRGPRTGHIYKAVTKEQWSSDEDGLGWMTKDQAEERFGAENVVVTESVTICPSCASKEKRT